MEMVRGYEIVDPVRRNRDLAHRFLRHGVTAQRQDGPPKQRRARQ